MSACCRPALRGYLLSSATILALCSSPAAAQDGEGLFTLLGRIILGAGTAKIAIDTPQAVTALEQADIDQRQPKTLSDLFKGVPGVQIAGASSRPLGQSFNIRGVGNTEQPASEERIKIVVDGAPKFFEGYRMGSFFGDVELFKRVEVLRGPASATLYGSGTIGGVIAFTTKDADDFLTDDKNTALRFKSSYAANGDTLGLGLIYAHRAENAEFIAALNRTSGGEMSDGAGAPILGTEFNNKSALLKSKFNFGNDDDQNLTLSFSRTDTDQKNTRVAQTGGSAILPAFGLADISTLDDTATVTWRHGFVENDLLDLTVQLSYTNTEVQKRNFHGGPPCAPRNSSIFCDSNYGYESHALKIENTADLSSGNWENYLTFGVQLSEQKRTANSSVGSFAFHPEGKDKRIGTYIQGEFTWNDKLVLFPGLRVDFGDRTPSAIVANTGGTATSVTAVSPKLAALYKFNDSFAIFGSLARTERMPVLDELYSSGGVQVASLNLEKEKAETIELGFTYQAQDLLTADDSLQLKVTGFHSDLSNLIARNTGGAVGTPYYVNITAAKIWGTELEAAYDSKFWFTSLAWSDVKSKNKATDQQLADTPAQNVALTVGAKLPEQGVTFGWRAYYFDSSVPPSTFYSGAFYDTHDAFVTWKPQAGALTGFEVNLTVENIFDKKYQPNLALDNAPGRNAKLSLAKVFTW